MKIKAIVSLLVTLAMIASTLTVTVGAGDSDGCGGLGVTDDEIYPFGDNIKEVWDESTQDWAEVTVAEINDTVRFRITVVYCETDHEDAFSVRNITVNDTLPDCLEYADNANIIPDYQYGKTIIWEFAGPYYSNDEGYCVVATIEFDAKVVDYTSENGEFNLVQVIGLEKCSSRNLYGEDIATVIVYEPQCGEIVLDKKVWDGQTWVDNAVVGLGPVTFNITVTYFAGCGTEATDIVVRDYLYPAGDVEWTYSSDYDSNFAPSIANISFIQWNLTEDFGVVLYDGQSVSIEFTITLVAGDGSIENCAEVDAFEHCCGCDLCDADCATVTIECIPEIVVEKQVWADGEWSEYLDQVYLNETVSFKIDIYYYDCGSDYEILNLIVEDELPCCLEYLETTSITSTGEMDDPTIELVDNYNIYWNWNNWVLLYFKIKSWTKNYFSQRCFNIIFDFVPLYPRNFTSFLDL